jgi:hypothetical protein
MMTRTAAALAAALTLAGLAARAGDDPPWGKGETPAERAALDKTAVCTDGKSHFVVIAPHEKQLVQLYYGDGKKLVAVPLPPWVLTGDSFFEPRFFARTRNPSFRGVDMRLYGSVDHDADKKTCAVTCGERTTKLALLDDAAKKDVLGKATFEPSPQKRAAHALARDTSGRYFYVDRGNTPDTEKSFRLFVGPKGSMKLQKMTNVVADSEGEIFTTRSGSLRYVSDRRAPPIWIEHGKKTTLTVIPVDGNYQLIYNELGVYLGEKLGTPCDDL